MQPVAPTSRKNVTKLAQLFTAGQVDVCKQGHELALRFHTTEGLVIIRMEERHFVRDCRGPRDANGNPLRRYEDLDDETQRQFDVRIARRTMEREAAGASVRYETKPTTAKDLTRIERLGAARADWQADPALGLSAAADRHQVLVTSLRESLIKHLGLEEYRRLSALRGNHPHGATRRVSA